MELNPKRGWVYLLLWQDPYRAAKKKNETIFFFRGSNEKKDVGMALLFNPRGRRYSNQFFCLVAKGGGGHTLSLYVQYL